MATVNKDFRVKNNISIANTADTATAASHYIIETGSDGVIRPKTLANVRTEIVTTAAVNSAAATTVGTVTNGTWNATAIGAANGGTGQTSYAVGDILYASASNALSKLAGVATGNALISGGVTTAPSWGKIGLTTHISGILPLANGGTNANLTAANGGVIYSTASAMAVTSAGSAGQALVSAGAAAPVWTTLTLENLPGAFVKRSVKAATTGSNITLAGGAPSTLDGVALAANDRILVKDQTAPAQNGIYIVQTLGTGANGTWVRSADADSIDEIASAFVAVDQGTQNGGLTFDNDVKSSDTLGTTSITWSRIIDVLYASSTYASIASPTFTGTVIMPTSATSGASIRIPHGTAPTAPTNGDIWTTTSGLFARINSATIGPFGQGNQYYQTTAPSSPAIGDIWVDSDETLSTLNSNDFATKAYADNAISTAIMNSFMFAGM